MTHPLHILHLEDNANDVALARSSLAADGIECVTKCVHTRDQFLEALDQGGIDLILSDFTLPAFDGMSALEIAHARCPDVPFILVSGTLGEELSIDALKHGATDYVFKHRLSRLGPAIRRAMEEVGERLKRTQAEVKREEYSHKLEVLSRRLVAAQETERRNIARELHDEIGQTLTVMQLNLQSMLHAPGAAAMAPRLNETYQMVGLLLEQVQDISLNLRPSMLDDLGLEPALRWYIKRQAGLLGLQAKCHIDQLEHSLDPMVKIACFRVAQEAMTNVVRHSRAQEVSVELRNIGGQLHLRVRDDGVGFDVEAIREKAACGESLGIISMEERAELAGGGLAYTSSPMQGTEVHAWFPLKWQTSSTEMKVL